MGRAVLCMGLVGTPRFAQGADLVLRVQGETDRDSGARTLAIANAVGIEVNFGPVPFGKSRPLNGDRVELARGMSRYVATFLLTPDLRASGFEVAATQIRRRALPDLGDPWPALGRRSTRLGRAGVVDAPRTGILIPSEGRRSVTHVDLYLRLQEPPLSGATVAFAPGDETDWTREYAGTPLGTWDLLIAEGVPVGEPFLCQVAWTMPPTASGRQMAELVLTARPSVAASSVWLDLPRR